MDDAYVNDSAKRRYTAEFSFAFYGGAVVYRSKTQLVNALSSTETELIAAVTSAKTARFLMYIL